MKNLSHEPSPEFQRYLEWQVTSALRRRERFAPRERPIYAKYFVAASAVAASMLLGAAGVAAADRIQSNQTTQVLSAQQQGELQLAQMQLALAQKTADEAKRRADIGVAAQDDAAAAGRLLRTAVIKLQRIKLNLDEVNVSGTSAQDDITSPVVHGRDFVLERLQLDLQLAQIGAEDADRTLAMAKRRADVGLTDQMELIEKQADMNRATNDLQAVQEKITLRQRFLAGGLSVKAATDQRLLLVARYQLKTAEFDLDLASKRYARLEQQFKIGVIGKLDLLKGQLDMLNKQQDVAALQARIRTLEQGGGEER